MSTYDEDFDSLDRILLDLDDSLDDLDGLPLDALYETEAESGLLYADSDEIAEAMASIANGGSSDD